MAAVSPAARASIERRDTEQDTGEKVDAPKPDLSVTRPLPLAELNAGISGKLVGPKAANLGELAKNFPGLVAPAVALPFGVYAQHASAGPGSPKARLDAAFADHRAGRIDDATLAAEVEAVRVGVEGLRISDATRAELASVMAAQLGPPETTAVFVRSDTNVEDLPKFTGAGLNKTIPNVVGLDAQLAAIPKVWASPFVPRAMAWRTRALKAPEEVYPSVLLMKSVPSDKSGVLVTADVATGGKGVTIAMSWGVGGAVDGESAETLVLRDDGTDVVVSEARLTPALGDDGQPLPWDMELGFVAGKLALFQARPLVERGALRADRVVAALAPGERTREGRVALSRPPGAPGAGGAP
jgi:hypothetical protein